uniref:Uncharacterized protein n=1 Tax=Avena sativa TaxID=4498 RepID=A0ACD5UB70_AVESA
MVNMAAASAWLLLLCLSLLLASSTSTGPYDPPTVPELMDRFGLPRALLPTTARRYLLHDDGSFELFLDDLCEVEVGGYRVLYDIRLTGSVAAGAVTGLEGVRVRVLFVWVPVTGVEVGGGVVTLSVGPVKKSFPAVGFKTSPRCATAGSAGAADLSPSFESS